MSSHPQREIVGFPVSKPARQDYDFPEQLFAWNGKSHIATFHAARLFAQYMNRQRDLITYPEKVVRASQINAIAIIHGITQYLFEKYCALHPTLFDDAFAHLHEALGDDSVGQTLASEVDEFPPMDVYRGSVGVQDYLAGVTFARRNRDITLEETVLLWMTNINPAFDFAADLFDDETLEEGTRYEDVIAMLRTYFDGVAEGEPAAGDFTGGFNIFEFLLAPIKASPNSLEGQLRYIYDNWGGLIDAYAHRLLRSLDLIAEENKAIFAGPGPALGPSFEGLGDEARFTADRDWMPNLVLLAKNAYVWLDQLSKTYDRPITRLDQIPDEELDKLAGWGFSGLWLIGLWERSPASQTIKQLCGNPEAVASAYSLYEYQVADDLGGEAAINNLKERAWQRGIRLASDMVPNHFGLDSKAVIENPDWFISLNHSPFPSYTFNGPDVSDDSRVSIYIEDHYYDQSDAAVVFKRVDTHTGDTRYIYHGNDGTSMPWNDTAQLNYLDPTVREAMIQIILDVARQFPIIRFDAAMTLAKKHVQRLWFPEPGSGGAIASRSEHGMTKDAFEQAMPNEFWREVVDRVLEEVPDTLLLAEAFWLMEGYFVRTLGMHRVYNSAFMNMLRDEDNQKYRIVIKDTLEFDPDILKRYVNFMNNPDERTAVDQFGRDDKYFGVATLLATLPGLPMFGHGQIEGFEEKYGMEYRRAYWDETPDDGLIVRHELQIFPLLRKRYLFAGAENFLLYDFVMPDGGVNEDVFAYSNRVGDERALIIYHNRYADARGHVRMSTAYLDKSSETLVHKNLGEGLGLPYDGGMYCIFRDHRSGLEYIRNCKELHEQGLYTELGAYQCHVFLDFRIVSDWAGQYSQLAHSLGGRGVPNMAEALQAMQVRPVLEPFQALVTAEVLADLLDEDTREATLETVEERATHLFAAIEEFVDESAYSARSEHPAPAALAEQMRERMAAVLALRDDPQALLDVELDLEAALADDAPLWEGLLGWAFVHNVGAVISPENGHQYSRSWIDDWLFGKTLHNALQGINHADPDRTLTAIKLATSHQDVLAEDDAPLTLLETLLNDADGQRFLNINRYEDVVWFNQEGWDDSLLWLTVVTLIKHDVDTDDLLALFATLHEAGVAAEFQVEKLEEALTDETDEAASSADDRHSSDAK